VISVEERELQAPAAVAWDWLGRVPAVFALDVFPVRVDCTGERVRPGLRVRVPHRLGLATQRRVAPGDALPSLGAGQARPSRPGTDPAGAAAAQLSIGVPSQLSITASSLPAWNGLDR